MDNNENTNRENEERKPELEHIFDLRKTISLIAAAVVLAAAILMAITTDSPEPNGKTAKDSVQEELD